LYKLLLVKLAAGHPCVKRAAATTFQQPGGERGQQTALHEYGVSMAYKSLFCCGRPVQGFTFPERDCMARVVRQVCPAPG